MRDLKKHLDGIKFITTPKHIEENRTNEGDFARDKTQRTGKLPAPCNITYPYTAQAHPRWFYSILF